MLPTGPGIYARRGLSEICYVVLHHSGVNSDCSAEGIAGYHVLPHGPEGESWPGIGYHFVAHWDGDVERCHDLEVASYNVAGRNRECVGICIPGNWSLRAPPEYALAAARGIVSWVRDQCGWEVPARGHRDLALLGYGTTCPGGLWRGWVPLMSGG